MSLIVKRKRMMDSVGHYARPELLQLILRDEPTQTLRRVSVPARKDLHEPDPADPDAALG